MKLSKMNEKIFQFHYTLILVHSHFKRTIKKNHFLIECSCLSHLFSVQKSSIATFPWNGSDAVGLNAIGATHNSSSSNNNDTSRNNSTNSNNNTTNNHIVTSPLSSGTPTGNGTGVNSPSSVTLATTSSSAIATAGGTTMPVGGVQSQNHTQGLVHWMSAVMAEHMTSNSHHDPTVGMHYMWNGGVDVSIY